MISTLNYYYYFFFSDSEGGSNTYSSIQTDGTTLGSKEIVFVRYDFAVQQQQRKQTNSFANVSVAGML